MNRENRIIKGHYDLELIVGSLYEVHFGVNQGIYVYVGEQTEGFWEGASIFKNIDTDEYFNYYGVNSPFEFTSIVTPYKE